MPYETYNNTKKILCKGTGGLSGAGWITGAGEFVGVGGTVAGLFVGSGVVGRDESDTSFDVKKDLIYCVISLPT